mgnify:CR=1 FL=1
MGIHAVNYFEIGSKETDGYHSRHSPNAVQYRRNESPTSSLWHFNVDLRRLARLGLQENLRQE